MDINKKNNNSFLKHMRYLNLLSVSCGLMAFVVSIVSYGQLVTSVNNQNYLIQQSTYLSAKDVQKSTENNQLDYSLGKSKTVRSIFGFDYRQIPLEISYILRGQFFVDEAIYQQTEQFEENLRPVFNAVDNGLNKSTSIQLSSVNIRKKHFHPLPTSKTIKVKDSVKLYSGRLDDSLPKGVDEQNPIDLTPIKLDFNGKAQKNNSQPLMSYEVQSIDTEDKLVLRAPKNSF